MKTVHTSCDPGKLPKSSLSLWFAKWLTPAPTTKRLLKSIDTISVVIFTSTTPWIYKIMLLVSLVIYNVLDSEWAWVLIQILAKDEKCKLGLAKTEKKMSCMFVWDTDCKSLELVSSIFNWDIYLKIIWSCVDWKSSWWQNVTTSLITCLSEFTSAFH